MSSPRPVFVDCDPGVDDALALAYLLASPEVELVGIGSVHGNVSAVQAAQNALDLLALAGRPDVPVAVGSSAPHAGDFAGGCRTFTAASASATSSLPAQAPVPESAVELLVRMARQHPGLKVVSLGPLTNLAAALRAHPELVDLVGDVVVMGGAALAPGNLTPAAEANIGNDPEAAAAVLRAPWDVTLVPLDVTMEAVLEESDRERLLQSDRPVARTLGAVLDLYFEFYVGSYGRRCCALHDPLAAAVAVGAVTPDVAPVVSVVVDDTSGPGRGQTICDLRGRRIGYPAQPGAHCRVVLSVVQDFAAELMNRLLLL